MQHDTSKSSKTAARSALLRLVQGTSTRQSWLLTDRPRASTVTIGCDPSCDWQVEAPGVAGHALSLALIDGELFIASGSRAIVTMNDQPLAEDWQQLEDSALVELGAAQIEITHEAEPAALVVESERDRPTFTEGLETSTRRETERESWLGRLSHSSLIDTPTILGRTAESRANHQLWRYASLLLFTALAYRAWLLLLDSL